MTRRDRRILLIGLAAGVTAVAVSLVLTALSSTVRYFYTPSDLQNLANRPAGTIRLGGIVKSGSVRFSDGGEAAVSFVIQDEIAEISVSHRGILPDLFREGQGVVVQGELDPSGALSASEVLAKHDENYMPKEVADALKRQGRWKDSAPQPPNP